MGTRLMSIVLLVLLIGAVAPAGAEAIYADPSVKAALEAEASRAAAGIQEVEPGAEVQEAPQAIEIRVEPSEVRAGMFFDGATLEITALVPEGLEITVTCIGGDEPSVLNRKGKALGLIWMNVGEVHIDGAPDLYLLQTSSELGGLAGPTVLAELEVGYEALEARTTLEGTEGNDSLYFREFLSLKESDGLYGVREGTVERVSGDPGLVRVRTEVSLPPKTPPGEYRLLIHGFGENGSFLLGENSLRVQQVGMAAAITTLATDHGLFYGIFAVAVAIVVGLLTGVLFGLGSKKAH